MKPTMNLEQELREANARVRELEAEAATEQEAAEKLVAGLREKGINPITDEAAFDEVDAAYKPVSEKKQEIAATRARIASLMEHMSSGAPKTAVNSIVDEAVSFAQMVLSHPAYAHLTPDVLRGQGALGALAGVDVLDRKQVTARLRAGENLFASAGADLSGGIPIDQRLYPPVEILRRTVKLVNLITVGQTDTESVVYSQQTLRTSNAKEKGLGVAYDKSLFDFEKVTANVKSIGHYTDAYREQIADAAQFQTVIENQLSEDVMIRLEDEILKGDGSGDNLEGILHTNGIQSVHLHSGERRIEALHRAITKVRLAFREPNGILLHPTDYEETLFEKTGSSADGGYVWLGALAGTSADTPATLWGLPVVVSPVATEASGVVAYWRDATLWMRAGVSIRLSDSHEDYFVRRMVAVLAEMRAAFSVQRPSAFCEVNLIPS